MHGGDEVHVVARVDRVLVLHLPELKGEQRVFAPQHVLLDLDLCLANLFLLTLRRLTWGLA